MLQELESTINQYKSVYLPAIKRFLRWFVKLLQLHFDGDIRKGKFTQYTIVDIDFGKGVGTEQAGIRPAVIVGETIVSTASQDLLVASCTTAIDHSSHHKRLYRHDILLQPSKQNRLKYPSIVRLQSIRQVSKKRICYIRGKLSQEEQNQIAEKLQSLFRL